MSGWLDVLAPTAPPAAVEFVPPVPAWTDAEATTAKASGTAAVVAIADAYNAADEARRAVLWESAAVQTARAAVHAAYAARDLADVQAAWVAWRAVWLEALGAGGAEAC